MSATYEHTHGKPGIRRARADRAPALAASAPSARRKRPHRTAIGALLEGHRRALSGAQGADAAELARRTLRVLRGAQRELGAFGAARTPSVLAHLLAFAEQRVVAEQLTIAAAAAGLASERGLTLAAEARQAQGRSERSHTAAIAAAGLLRGRAPDPGAAPPPWLVPVPDDDSESPP